MIRSRTITRGVTLAAVLAGTTALTVAGVLTTPALATPSRAAAPPAGPAHQNTSAQLAGSAVPFARPAAATADVAGSRPLTIQVWLAPRTSAAQSYATAVSTPGNPRHGQFLSPAQYAARFGATPAQAASVEAWLTGAGFTGVAADAQRGYVRATAPATVIDQALGVRLRYYRPAGTAAAGPYELRANDRPVSVPAALAGTVLGVTGLDNAAPATTLARPSGPAAGKAATVAPPPGPPATTLPVQTPTVAAAPGTAPVPVSPPVPLPAPVATTSPTATPTGKPTATPAPTATPTAPASQSFPCSSYYGQHYATELPALYGTSQFPTQVCGYSATQLRAAYGYGPRYTGQGQTIALVELGLVPYMFTTLADYASANGIAAPSPALYKELSIGHGDDCGTPFDVEEQMDVEASYALAPGATHLVIGGDSCDDGDYGLQTLFNADTAALDGDGKSPLASVVSNSWEGFAEDQPSDIDTIEHAILVRAAAEGVGMYYSSGDTSGVLTPSSDPFATAVGGTTLAIGNANPRLYETGWSSGMYTDTDGSWEFQGEDGAAGGGPSQLYAQPSYQAGVVPATLATAPGDRPGLVRTVPDISADADPFTGMAVGLLTINSAGQPTGYTQAPTGGTSLSAPLVAALVTDAEQGMPSRFGFVNPALYQLSGTGAYDYPQQVTSNTPTQFKAVACGVDACGVLSLVNFDDQSWSMDGYTGQVTHPGYGTMTGIGVPDGLAFISALRALEAGA
jgi:subtilase family serine protease